MAAPRESNKQCVHCGSNEIRCTDSRTPAGSAKNVTTSTVREDVLCRRRYHCAYCGGRFTTYEVDAYRFEALSALTGSREIAKFQNRIMAAVQSVFDGVEQ